MLSHRNPPRLSHVPKLAPLGWQSKWCPLLEWHSSCNFGENRIAERSNSSNNGFFHLIIQLPKLLGHAEQPQDCATGKWSYQDCQSLGSSGNVSKWPPRTSELNALSWEGGRSSHFPSGISQPYASSFNVLEWLFVCLFWWRGVLFCLFTVNQYLNVYLLTDTYVGISHMNCLI